MSPSTHPTKARPAVCDEPAVTGWFDAHNHLHDARLGQDPPALIRAQQAAGIAGCVVNATRECDWPLLAELAKSFPGFVRPAFGIHPWYAHTARAGWQDRLREWLDQCPTAGVGECGIDGWVSAPALSVQRAVFLDQITLARETGRPLTIHCLRAWGELAECFRQQAPRRGFLLHSFSGSLETARHLAKAGAWFSFSGSFLHERKRAVCEVFRQLPRELVLVETDAPDMLPPPPHITHPLPGHLHHPANLPAIGTALARRWQIDPDELASVTHQNTRAWLGDG